MSDSGPVLKRLEDDQINYLWVGYHDYSGRGAAKTIPRASMPGAIKGGVVFAKANLNMDAEDVQVPDATLLANSGDMLAVPDPRSYTLLPRFPGTALMHAHLREPDGAPWDGCPRTQLDTVIQRAADAGFSIQAALEPEFTLFLEKPGADPVPVNATQMFSQSGLAAANSFITDLLGEMSAMGVKVPQLGKEYGQGQYEVSLQHGTPIEAVDRYLHFRATLHDIARRHGLIATVMPKPYAHYAGNSLHVHLSVWTADGKTDLTAATENETSLSETGRWFVGGLLKHAAALTAVGSPTVNSYKRLLPGSWAPANTYWGYGNRSGVVRVPGVGDRRHVEFRSPDNTTQPYLLLSALIGAGLDGIRNQIDPGDPFEGDVGHLSSDEISRYNLGFLPRTLPEALAALEEDEVVCEAVGPEILKHFLSVKRNELATYNLLVHQWERATYLELH